MPFKDKGLIVLHSFPDSCTATVEAPILAEPLLGKRSWLEVVSSSPKKLTLALTCTKFNERSSGLVESSTWVIDLLFNMSQPG